MNTRQDEKYSQMAQRYAAGLSLTEVGAEFGVTRQSVYTGLKRRGVQLRTKQPKLYQEFDGLKFTQRSHGYYARTDGDRELMHRYVWRFHYGEIPPGHDVHHRNHNPTDNRIENLECLSKSEHSSRHGLGCNQFGHRCGR